MIDYDKPWGWADPKKKSSNSLAPLGAGAEPTPGPAAGGGPDMGTQALQSVGTAVAGKAIDAGAKGMAADATAEQVAGVLGNGASSAAGSQAAMLAEQTAGMGGEALGMTADAAGSSLGSMAGPLGAAMGGVMKGEYDEAAGAALGSVLGTYFGPVGTMVGGKVGGYAGNAVGSMFGMADGGTVPEKKGLMQTIWDKMVDKGRAAVEESAKASTGNHGALGAAKGQLVSRKQRLDDEIRKAEGYADGTTGGAVGGKGVGGGAPAAPTPMMPAAAGGEPQGGKGVGGGNPATAQAQHSGRPFGSTAPTSYFGERGQGGARTQAVGFRPTSLPAASPVAAAPAPLAPAPVQQQPDPYYSGDRY